MGAAEVSNLLEGLLRGLVEGIVEPEPDAPPEVQAQLDDLLSKADTYRDAALMVLAFAAEAGTGRNAATPPEGRRSVAQRLEQLCDELNIRARRDAFQTVAKGADTLLGRKRDSWNQLLEWASGQEAVEPLAQALRYMATRIAATSRDLPAMPPLDVSTLTFRRVVRIIDELLAQASGGAHQQFAFAAFLHALSEEYGHRHIETKTLAAADAAAGTAADVQVLEGGRIVEAYEVTANPWASKVAQAVAILRHYDLPRVHIVAPGPAPTGAEMATAIEETPMPAGLIPENIDLSVLDVAQECRSLVHRLSRPGRRAALNKLWEHLAMRQPNDDLVAGYVQLLHDAGVVAAA